MGRVRRISGVRWESTRPGRWQSDTYPPLIALRTMAGWEVYERDPDTCSTAKQRSRAFTFIEAAEQSVR